MSFKAMEMHFYEDGLSHETEIFHSEDSDECYRHLIDFMKTTGGLGRVVEIDANGDRVWTEIPYPRVSEPEFPEFFLHFLRTGEVAP